VNYGTRPLGAVVGGSLGALIGIRPTLWIAAVGGMTGILWLLPSPLPRFRMPDEPAGDDTQAVSEDHGPDRDDRGDQEPASGAACASGSASSVGVRV